MVDFLHTLRMAAPFKRSVEEGVHNLERHVGGNETGREGDDIGIVVLTGKGGEFIVPTERTANIGVFVGGH